MQRIAKTINQTELAAGELILGQALTRVVYELPVHPVDNPDKLEFRIIVRQKLLLELVPPNVVPFAEFVQVRFDRLANLPADLQIEWIFPEHLLHRAGLRACMDQSRKIEWATAYPAGAIELRDDPRVRDERTSHCGWYFVLVRWLCDCQICRNAHQ